MLRKKRENKTYREFTQLNKIANQAPVAEEVKKYKAFPDKIEYYWSYKPNSKKTLIQTKWINTFDRVIFNPSIDVP